MKSQIKRVLFVALAVIMCIALVACQQNTPAGENPQQSAGTAEPSAKVEEKQEIIFAGWSKEEEVYKESLDNIFKKWNDANPNNPVTWVGWPWADTCTQVIIRTNGGEQVDVIQSDINWITALNGAKALYDVSDLLDWNWVNDNYTDASMALAQRGEATFGLPWTVASIGTIYNKDLLEKAGVTSVPTTIGEFEAALEALKGLGDDIIPYSLATKDATCATDFAPWLYAFGGSIIDEEGNPSINSEAGIKTLEWIKSLYDRGYIRMDMSRFDARVLYGQEKVGFHPDAFGAKSALIQNGIPEDQADSKICAMTRPIVNDGDNPTSTMWGWVLAVGQNTKNPEKALDFIKFMVSEEIALSLWDTNSLVPANKNTINNEVFKNNTFLQDWTEITATGKLMESGNYTAKADIENALTNCVQAVITGTMSAEEAAAKADEDIAYAISK